MVSRRELIGGLAASVPAWSRYAPRRKPNFLFLLADDHAGYVMGADGNRLAVTPNLDKLASEGTRFSNHFCNSPVCTPSRQSFFTGQMPHMAGVTRLTTRLSPDKPTIAKQLRTAGYTTGVFGKMHFNRPAEPGLHGFDVMMTERELTAAWQKQVKPREIPPEINTKPQWRPFKDPARIWLNADKYPYPRYDEEMKTSFQVRQASQFLEEHRDKPFALWVSFHEPHSPFDFPVEYKDRFDAPRFPVPKVGKEDDWQVPLIFRELSDADKQGINAAYYTSVEFLDRNIGMVLNKLRELNLEEDTFVVYSADHGYQLGQHGRFEKHCGFDESLRVPLIMKFPGRIRQGVVTDMTEHVDVTPTILEMLGADPVPVQHGNSLRPYLEGRKNDRRRDHIFSEYLENEEAFVRTDEWKFIFCSGQRERGDGYETDRPKPGRYVKLYNRKKDPGEFTDVAARNPKVVERLETLMLERFRNTHPEAASEPARLSRAEALEWYLKPRDV